MLKTLRFAVLPLFLLPFPASAAPTCDEVLKALGGSLADASCFASADLTTANAQTTPADNSIPGLPIGAFTPSRASCAARIMKSAPRVKSWPGSLS